MGDRRKKDDLEQSKRFVDAAKKLKSDESGKLFEQAITAVSKDSKKRKPESK
jgi:hypothetical protein